MVRLQQGRGIRSTRSQGAPRQAGRASNATGSNSGEPPQPRGSGVCILTRTPLTGSAWFAGERLLEGSRNSLTQLDQAMTRSARLAIGVQSPHRRSFRPSACPAPRGAIARRSERGSWAANRLVIAPAHPPESQERAWCAPDAGNASSSTHPGFDSRNWGSYHRPQSDGSASNRRRGGASSD